jgi:hypothetical protein
MEHLGTSLWRTDRLHFWGYINLANIQENDGKPRKTMENPGKTMENSGLFITY